MVGADVAGRPFAPDVLLSCGKGEAVNPVALAIRGLPHDAARKVAHVGRLCGNEAQVRPTEIQRHTQRLRVAQGEIRAVVAGPLERAQAQRVDHRAKQPAKAVHGLGDIRHIFNITQEIWRSGQHARSPRAQLGDLGNVCAALGAQWHLNQLDILEAGVGLHGGDVIRVQAGAVEYLGLALVQLHSHHHLGAGVRAVVYGGVGRIEAGEVADQGLVFEDGLQHALAHLCLVGGIGGVELAAHGQLGHHRGDIVVISPCAPEDRQIHASVLGELPENTAHFLLALAGGHVERRFEGHFLRHIHIEVIHAAEADGG